MAINKSDLIEKVTILLRDISKSANLFKVAAMLNEAKTDEERVYISQALGDLIDGGSCRQEQFTQPQYHHQSEQMFT